MVFAQPFFVTLTTPSGRTTTNAARMTIQTTTSSSSSSSSSSSVKFVRHLGGCSRRKPTGVLVVRRATIEEDDAKALGYGDKENMSESMKEFAEEGYPSDEDDIKDPRERDKAMKEAVGDVMSMAQSEADVINQAYDLIEKLSPGLKLKNRPPRSEGEEGKKEES